MRQSYIETPFFTMPKLRVQKHKDKTTSTVFRVEHTVKNKYKGNGAKHGAS